MVAERVSDGIPEALTKMSQNKGLECLTFLKPTIECRTFLQESAELRVFVSPDTCHSKC